MGYSIMTPFKSKKDRDLMFKFLSNNYRNIDLVLGTEYESKYTSEPRINEDISYSPSANIPVIGFDYNGSNFGRVFAFLICYWMAQMNGKESMVRKINKKFKYVLYDGNEKMYLSDNDTEFENVDIIIVDTIGFRKINKKLYGYKEIEENINLDEVDNKIFNELKRLTDLWKTK